MMKKVIGIVIVVIVALFLIGSRCSFKIGNTTFGKANDEISIKDNEELSNSNFQKEYLNKESLVIVNLWATWCKPCLEEMPILQKIAAENKDVKLVFLSIDKDSTELQSYLSKHRLNDVTFENRNYRKAIRNFLDGKDKNNLLYTDIVPKTYIIKNGKVVYKEDGGINYQEFSKKLNLIK
ncbi:TlpA disulfide reductase family protein [Chryseobacterium sp. MHB01]|uniref:TlpA family protein disulfide reductase n=1 Tax=Chryseobacterium sp. MHB01 TaxID=3109433 RepID=UPI002AFE8B31|nr:TlpA disulfide reductase family protein [Chryseobacterium sp. MHB01]MEA1847387.1 TlpA disulfide reductase family protein [Chryseobacterium sp. MHB01]